MASVGTASKITFAAADETDHKTLGQGRYNVNLDTGGSTVRLEAKHPTEEDTEFRTVTLPGNVLNTAVDAYFEIGGGCDVRVFVESYSATPGSISFTQQSL